ncbi:Permease of the drug/metabolite transporter (DMT) superfamily [Pedobacter terrae]|uniref:Permease of the drug/metabolite transporter (DMT) superfamily n=1 Tax=Pedobacter terrae TaxID=405671 RepID=A0A1G7MP24_9SPHI|nr:EamA family transporter [Pedobacter terrae]SDF63441.1 Permease of the drug/metabolite transporter (DMT) superfamily [Pedobacter terrae]
MTNSNKGASPVMVYLAFAIVYIVWGSTYFFIQKALAGFPPFILGALRFSIAGVFMLTWCKIKGEDIFNLKTIKIATVSGILMLGLGTGIVIWVEQFIPSGLVAIMVASAAIWFVVLDKSHWKENLSNKYIVSGLVIGFLGVILLFGDQIVQALDKPQSNLQVVGMVLLVFGPIAWAAGSLYSKYHPTTDSSVSVNTGWQMLMAGLVFLPGAFLKSEFKLLDWGSIPLDAWLSIIYLVLFGSIAAFSAYVWLLKVRPATQVSTYAYVNPVVAVLLSLTFTSEEIGLTQIIGLVIILGSVLLINLPKYKKA